MKVLRLALVLTVAGCFPKTVTTPPTLTSAQTESAATKWPGTTPESLTNGRTVYAAKCNGCHGYPDLHAVPEAKWPDVMTAMGKKAEISAKDRDDVLHFILAGQ